MNEIIFESTAFQSKSTLLKTEIFTSENFVSSQRKNDNFAKRSSKLAISKSYLSMFQVN